MTRFALAGAAIFAGALATSLALAQSNHRGAPSDRPDRAQDFATMRASFCEDHYARAAGRMAYLQAKLSLTPQQEPLFSAWRDIVLQTARTRANGCANEAMPDKAEGMPAREARMESRLEARLAALQAERPALTAFYQSLSDEQKRMFDHAGRHHEHEREHGMWEHHREMGGGDRPDDRGI